MSRTPYPFQKRVSDALLAGKNVILQAPTGAGKTYAALLPWLHATHLTGNDGNYARFPYRCIYSVPMRVLATQFHREVVDDLKSFATKTGRRDIRTVVQTGETPEDPKLENALIFATLDQTLSSALGIPYGGVSANLNAGAVMSSYCVWDEFHLFGRAQALPTTLHWLKMMQGITPFCLMTATFSRTLLDGLAAWLGAEVITIPAEERRRIPSQQGKIRTFHTDPTLLTADAVLATFNQRTIAICNTVDRAQALGAELVAKAPEGTVVKVLHSRFFQSDRRATTDWLMTHFGKNRTATSDIEKAILVTTQVVEVGVDVTCETLHTELAPASALVQRAGRCARFANESGRVIIHALPLHPQKGTPATAPYDIDPPTNLCERTWNALRQRDGVVMDYEAELELLQEVHAEDDRALLAEIQRNAPQHQVDMRNAMASHAAYEGRKLIRDIDNRQLVLHPDPNTDTDYLCKSPFARESLSIPRTTFFALAVPRKQAFIEDEAEEENMPTRPSAWLAVEEESGVDWALAVPKADPTAPLPHSEGYMGQPRYIWERVDTFAQLKGELLFAIHPALVRYTPALGLQFMSDGDPTRMSPEMPRNQGGRDSYTYRLETYAEHIQGLQRVYLAPFADGRLPALRDEMAYTLPRMAARLNITPAELERLICYLYVAHDVGKLSKGWQEWIHKWQTLIGKPCDPATAYAHTDFDDSREQREWQRTKMGKRPPHAAEGAAACLMLFGKALNVRDPAHPLLTAMVTAVVRHHAADHEGQTQKEWAAWQPGADNAVVAALAAVGGDKALLTMLRWQLLPLQPFLINPTASSAEAILTYLWCSRLLRLADQRSQEL
jgi:CRISPR-associated endonuclease/helicase Cas3